MSREIVANLTFKSNTGQFNAKELARLVEKGYLAKRRESKFTTKKTFAPSSIGYGHGTCARYWYQAFNGAFFVEKADALGVANMENGSAAHDRIQGAMELGGFLVEAETEMVLADPPVRGYIDAIVEVDGVRAIGEIKTTRPEIFLIRQASMKPSANHMYQILLYMKATGIHEGFIMYENKGDQTYLVIPVAWNDKNQAFLEEALDWLRKVRANWEESKGTDDGLPTRPWTRRNQTCRNCPLYEQCWPEDRSTEKPGVIFIEPMEVPKI